MSLTRQILAGLLGGVLLGVGDVAHGYRLREVGPFHAVFDKDGSEIVLEVAREEDD